MNSPVNGIQQLAQNPEMLKAALMKILQARQGASQPNQMMRTPPFQASPGGVPPQGGGTPGGGAPSGVGGGGVSFDTSGAGATMPKPVQRPTPHMAFNGIFGMLATMKNRKEEKQNAEAQNIAQNLMDALSKKDVARVYEIMNDKNSTKVLDKVYKGWLEKVNDINTPDKTAPEVKSFETGIINYLNNKGPQPDMPKQIAGRMVPQPTPAANLGAASTNAAVQSAQQQPSLLTGGLSPSEQVTKGRVAAGMQPPPYVSPEVQTKIQTSFFAAKRAELEVQKAEADAKGAEARGEAASKVAATNLSTAQTRLDIERTKLSQIMQGIRKPPGVSGAKAKAPTFQEKLKIESIDKAEDLLKQLQAQKKGMSASDMANLAQLLKTGGANNLAGGLAGMWNRLFSSGDKDVSTLLKNVQDYKAVLNQAGAEGSTSTQAPGDAGGPPEGETDDDATPEVGDEVDFEGDADHPAGRYRFDGTQYVMIQKKP